MDIINIIEMKTDELIPYINNPRNNDGAVDYVAASIKEFGFKVPIVVDKDNVIVTGHTRLKAAQKLGLETVPVIKADDLTDAQIKAFRLADNKVSEFAEWDMEKLGIELQELDDYDMEGFGFDPDALLEKDTNPDEIQEDEVPEPPEEPKSKPGDIYQLGNHRLMCGDSTKAEDVEKLMDGEKADLVITDPPYNVEYVGAKLRASDMAGKKFVSVDKEIENDVMSEERFTEFLTKVFSNMKSVIMDKTAFYIWYAGIFAPSVLSALKENDLHYREILIWVKNTLILGWNDYQYKHEPCVYGFNDYNNHYFSDDRTLTTVFDDTITDFSKLKKEELVKILETVFSENVPTTVIYEDKPNTSKLHPTMKPVKLIARLMNNSSRKDELVLDLFGGSGTTLIAAEQMGRKCNMMELDPHYVDVIIERWENLTGEKAVKLN